MLSLLVLIFAGEMIFCLPFHLPRYFRPSFLETFSLSNAALGDAFAIYGITAMLAYFPGGMVADRLPPRTLMTTSLLATAAGGLYLYTLPSAFGLAIIYGYWGVTTILLFWAAMIRATRQWGGESAQGKAFGILDGGRGLAAAACASLAVVAFSSLVPDAEPITTGAREQAMRAVIGFYLGATVLAALGVWLFLDDVAHDHEQGAGAPRRQTLTTVVEVLKNRTVWLQAGIVICAYCGYKGLDNIALYAHQVLGVGEAQAAGITAKGAYVRPLAAVCAGLLADRFNPAKVIVMLFGLMALSAIGLALSKPDDLLVLYIYGLIALSFAAVFALRGVYFALTHQIRVPFGVTGTAVGLVSVVGYTPDIFFAPIAGRMLDAAPGLAGHQSYYWLLASIAIVGLASTVILLHQLTTKENPS